MYNGECPIMKKLMDPYLDGELGVNDALRVDAHLQECEDCREMVLAQQEFLGLVHDAASVAPAPEFTARCLRAALEREVRRSASRRATRMSWIAASVSVLSILVLIITIGASRQPVPNLVQVAVMQHQTSLQQPDAFGVLSSDPATVSSWFDRHLPFKVELPKNGVPEFRLVGGRVATAGATRAAYVAYQAGEETVSLLVNPPQEIRIMGREVINFRNILFHPADVGGFHTLEWSDSGHTYVLVASSPRLVSQACLLCHGSERGREFISGFANGI